MIIMLIVIAITAILLGIAIFGGFYKEADYFYAYDKNGEDSRYFKEVKFKDDGEEKLVLEGLLSNEKYKDLNPNTLMDVVKYDKIPCKRTVKYHVRYRNEIFDDFLAAFVLGCIIGGCGLIAGFFCINANTTYSIETNRMSYVEATIELENNQAALLKFYETGVAKDIDISSSGLPERIKEHNGEVRELVQKVKSEKIALTNPWICWFVNPACKDVDIPRIEATYINLN